MLTLDQGLQHEAEAALKEWVLGKRLAEPCLQWRMAIKNLLSDRKLPVSEMHRCTVYKPTEPIQLTLHAHGVNAVLADHSCLSFTAVSEDTATCEPVVTWKNLRNRAEPTVELSLDAINEDQLRWPNGWHKLDTKPNPSEVFISTANSQGIVVVRLREVDLVRHYALQREIHSVEFGCYGHIGAEFISLNGHVLEIHGGKDQLDHHCHLSAVIFPDECINIPLDLISSHWLADLIDDRRRLIPVLC